MNTHHNMKTCHNMNTHHNVNIYHNMNTVAEQVVLMFFSSSSSSPAFPCHENGATVLQYAPKQQLLVTGGRKGFVCVFDIRQRQLLHTFQAHDSAIKALALDASEDFFVTGSAEGNVKVSPLERRHTECGWD